VFVMLGMVVAVKCLWCVLAFVWTHFLRPKADLRKYGSQSGAWAVVTGCTDGIGLGYARKLGEAGFNLILISRNEDKLREVAKQFNTKTKTVAVDCSNLSNATFDAILNAVEGLDVGVLVNNVGVNTSCPDDFEKTPYEEIQRIYDVNVSFTSKLTYLFIPILQKRKKSLILIISSVTGARSNPLLSAYAGSKAFNDIFARSLHTELAFKGIDALSVTPAYVVSNMSKLKRSSFFCADGRQICL